MPASNVAADQGILKVTRRWSNGHLVGGGPCRKLVPNIGYVYIRLGSRSYILGVLPGDSGLMIP